MKVLAMDVGSYAIVFACAAWAISLLVAVKVVPKLAAKRICEQFGLTRVEVNGKEIYAVEDLEGKPIKIPIGTQTDAEGITTAVLGYAPLPMTLTYLAAEQAALKVKMTLFNAKSQVSKKVREGLMQQMGADPSLEGNPDLMALTMTMLPAKLRPFIIAGKALGLGNTAQTAQSASTTRGGGKEL